MTQEKNRPVKKIKNGRVHCAIRKQETRSGEVFYVFNLFRYYPLSPNDPETRFATTSSFGKRDLDDIDRTLVWCRQTLAQLEAGETDGSAGRDQ